MTRQIEFTAWDKREKRFLSQEEMNEIGGFYYIYGLDPNPKEFELVQWTGLLDKNGKKIFEGDIVRIWDNPKNYVEAVEWDEFSAGFILSDGHGLRDFEFIEIEVLGNIFENPELLTQK